MKIALASSNNKDVDLHFGKAYRFLIYEFDGDKTNFIETREVSIDPNQQHQWQKSLAAIKDCDVVICVQVGMNGKFGIEKAGLKLVEDRGSVENVLKRYVKHYKFMKKPLF
ncbi:NifB/NifX family molybdenum-iron cluster-binding protein [Methanobacterium alcaliphilum]|uniref:NifB/NifX family molybdenum-iron cluster-binding protein n=1 Tax=Methanobacterium alcaliphilum TaxID=392018 RepID=UPI00200A3C2E|nr:NifB/NifX family molybdenum-iron cluster-binding protein [Methanobacterium alcaliphilum]MCK9151904.1 dinitrogenase iron-molybdenum cofactor biosynthesis protein [Methanobacterium alcaliphilum]